MIGRGSSVIFFLPRFDRFGSVRFGSVRFGSPPLGSSRDPDTRTVDHGLLLVISVRFGSLALFNSVRFGSVRFASPHEHIALAHYNSLFYSGYMVVGKAHSSPTLALPKK